jgi:hypothetical protein
MTLLTGVMSSDGSHCPPQIELSPKNTYVLKPWGCCIEPGANEEVEMVETLLNDTTKETTPGRQCKHRAITSEVTYLFKVGPYF